MKNKIIYFSFFLFLISCSEDNLRLGPEKNRSKMIDPDVEVDNTSFSPFSLSTDYFLFMRGQSSSTVRYFSSADAINWSSQVLLPGNTSASPAALHYNGKFYSVCKGNSTPGIFLASSTDGVNWTQVQIPGATSTGPGICVYNGEIYVFFVDNVSFAPTYQSLPMYVKSSDGINWTSPVSLCSGNCLWTEYNVAKGDVYAVSPFEVYFLATLYNNQNESVVIKTDYQMSSVSVIQRYNDTYPCTKAEQSDVGVAVANGLIAMKGKTSGYIFVSQGTGTCLTMTQLNVKTSKRPALIYKNGKYTLIFKGYSTDVLYSYESTNGVTWNNLRTIPHMETVAGPYLMVKY